MAEAAVQHNREPRKPGCPMPHWSLCLEINSDCTLDCGYCFRTVSGKELSLDFLQSHRGIIEKLAEKRLVISGGEPLIHSHFFEILEWLKNTYPKHEIDVTTGLLVNERTIDRLLAHDRLIDHYLLNFETSDDALLDQIKRRSCAAVLKQNLKRIVTAHPGKTRINVVLSGPEVVAKLSQTLTYLASCGVKHIKFFRDVRAGPAYQPTTADVELLQGFIRQFTPQITFAGLDPAYLIGDLKVPDASSSQALCLTNNGEFLEREERDALAVLEHHFNSMARFTKHLRGYRQVNCFYSRYLVLGLISLCRIFIVGLAGWAISGTLNFQGSTPLDSSFITYTIPLYAIYVTIWTGSLWSHRVEVLQAFNKVLNQYDAIIQQSSGLVGQKLLKQLQMFPATWDRYENVTYLKHVAGAYSQAEPALRDRLQTCVLDLAAAVDRVKTYEQYEDFRYLGYSLDTRTGLIAAEKPWRTDLFLLKQAVIGGKRIIPYLVLFATTALSSFYLKDPSATAAIMLTLLALDYCCVENMSNIGVGLFSISRNLAVKLYYQMKVPQLWQ